MSLFTKDNVFKFIKLFIITIAIFVFLLFAAWLIPDKMVKYNVEYSLNYIGEGWTPIFTYEDAASLDDYTDRLCLNNSIKEGSNEMYNTFQAMMDMKDYARYWHGYLVVLRPLLCFVNYLQIRYINMFLLMTLVACVFAKMKDRLGWGISISFIIALCTTNVLIVPWSLQFSPVFYIMLISLLFILNLYGLNGKKPVFWLQFFFFVGMVTNFLDFLSAPLLTAGIPVCIIISLCLREENRTNTNIIGESLQDFLFWGMGYALCWISKWLLSSIILNKNVLYDAVRQAKLRSIGGRETIIDTLTINLESMLMPYFYNTAGKWYGLLLMGLIGVFLIGILIAFHKANFMYMIPYFLAGVIPYIWMCIFKEHSCAHWIFVYRIQMITVFCILCIYVNLLDTNTLKQRILKMSKK